ncbi:MAG: hypothetical protein Q7V19_10065, partial [Bacteroidales bacterium]|nr:hypothetical protein [Bacteroidales bacterium]
WQKNKKLRVGLSAGFLAVLLQYGHYVFGNLSKSSVFVYILNFGWSFVIGTIVPPLAINSVYPAILPLFSPFVYVPFFWVLIFSRHKDKDIIVHLYVLPDFSRNKNEIKEHSFNFLVKPPKTVDKCIAAYWRLEGKSSIPQM